MDAHTLELLEFDKVRDLLAGYVACSLGKELARQLEPATDLERLSSELALVTEMVQAIDLGQAPPFGGLHDIRLSVRRAVIGAMLTADQLLEVAETLNCTGAIYRYRMRLDERCQRLIEMLAPIEDLGLAAKSIYGCIDSRGHVLDMASPELGAIRQRLADLDARVQAEIKRLVRDPKLREILRYPNATVSGDHYVLPVAINHRQKIPGVVHRTSGTGETVFIEPAAISSLSAERVVLKGEEDREIRRILRRLTAEVARIAKPLSHAVDLLARLDLITAKARFSRDYNMSAPVLNADGRLALRHARHPLLEHLFRMESQQPALATSSGDHREPPALRTVVPIDVRIGDTFKILIITGPNTGGKTVALKTTGLICLLAQCGMHVPAAEGSLVPVFNQILADIGDEQSLEQSLSTFSSHMSRIANILRLVSPQSLVLLDELGAGTDPTEGAALGRAILDELDRIGCCAMVTTHLGDLKTYAFTNPRAENAAVEFDDQTLRPTFRLLTGQFGMSNALRIARRLKLPNDLLRRARRYLKRRQRRVPDLDRVQALKADAEKAREEALQKQQAADRQRAEYELKMQQLQRDAEKELALSEWRSTLQAGDHANVVRFGQPGRIVRVDHKKGHAVVSVGLGQWDVPLTELLPLG